MTVHDINDALIDSAALNAIAKRAGITLQQARAVAGMIADLDIKQQIRLCSTCQLDRIRQSQRDARYKR